MSGLPEQIPQQSVPFGTVDKQGNLFIEINWFLYLYNLGSQVIGPGGGGGGTAPASPFDLLDMVDLDAAGADLPRAFLQLANRALTESVEADIANVDRQVVQGAPADSLDVDIASVDTQHLERGIANLRALESIGLDEVIGPTPRDVANALLLAAEPLLQDPAPAPQPFQNVTPGASPFTYTAPCPGSFSVAGGIVSAISITRQGIAIAASLTSGFVPLSRLDQVQITYSSTPTLVFLPS